MNIGTQMARIKFARDYFLVILNIITALSMLTLALESVGVNLTLEVFIIIIFAALLIFWLVGYYIDKHKIIESDYAKMLENTAKGQVIIWTKVWDEVIQHKLEELKVLKDV